MKRCIWCLNEASGKHVEHIIPEALGCPSGFVLDGKSICMRCNNNLGHLDQAVIDDFDFLAFHAGIPRKRNRPPKISSRGNVKGTVEQGKPSITFNMENYPVLAHDQAALSGYRGRDRDVKVYFQREGNIARVSYDVEIGRNPKFIRGIVKIALSSLAYFLGAEHVTLSKYDSIRNFVRNGKGVRHVLMQSSSDSSYLNQVWPPYESECKDYSLTFRIAAIEFLVDLSEHETQLPEFIQKSKELYSEKGWTVLPLMGRLATNEII